MPTAKVIAPTSVYGSPRSIGESLEVDEITLANLARKGRLERVTGPQESFASKIDNREEQIKTRRKTRATD